MDSVEADRTHRDDIKDRDDHRPGRVTGRRLPRDDADPRVRLLETRDRFRRQAGVADIQFGQGRKLGQDGQRVVVDLRAGKIQRL